MTTRAIVPNADGEGSLGTSDAKWGKVYSSDPATDENSGQVPTTKWTRNYVNNYVSDAVSNAVSNAHSYIRRNTKYAVGDVLTSPSLPPGCVIVVTQAGTTGSTEPDWATIKSNMGWVISDGTVTFYINDTLSKHSIGDIVYKPTTKTGEHEYLLPLDGQTIDGTAYKRLVDYMGSTTLPNLNGRYLRADSTPGKMVEAGLPNITGGFSLRPVDGGLNVTWETNNGAVKAITHTGDSSACVSKSSSFGPLMDVSIDASRCSSIYGNSTTVTPLTYTVRAYICYA